MKSVYKRKDRFPHSPLDYSNFSAKERQKIIKSFAKKINC